MREITDFILSQTNLLQVSSEVSKSNPREYRQFNSGSIEIEVAELLYSMIRLIQPKSILETGTHKGISTLYMALALEKNKKGHIKSYEVIEEHRQSAIRLLKDLKVNHRVTTYLKSSLSIRENDPIDFLLLDSEPQYRFDEFRLFWSRLEPGTIIGIHDLHPNLGHTGVEHHGLVDWPYGDFRPKLGKFIRDYEVQCFSFPTIRGLTFFQKQAKNYNWTNYLRGDI